jgi:cytochrome P450
MPFGGGPRQCIGINFAGMEAQFIIAMVAQRFELELVNKEPIQPVMKATIHPSRPIEMRLKRRLRERSVGS